MFEGFEGFDVAAGLAAGDGSGAGTKLVIGRGKHLTKTAISLITGWLLGIQLRFLRFCGSWLGGHADNVFIFRVGFH